ncbi:hypothetical protein QJS66_16485 [Kocuria rhizophila]|nr:hypothetical protein QJS66_16485 [Kocuria rhizophila]
MAATRDSDTARRSGDGPAPGRAGRGVRRTPSRRAGPVAPHVVGAHRHGAVAGSTLGRTTAARSPDGRHRLQLLAVRRWHRLLALRLADSGLPPR